MLTSWKISTECNTSGVSLNLKLLIIYNRNTADMCTRKLEGCLTVHLPHEIMWNANLMQLGNFIDIFLARHVSGTYAHHQEH